MGRTKAAVKLVGAVSVLLVCLLASQQSDALMSSSNYTIYADSIDVGGVYSSGGSFILEDTIGESPAGFTTSSVYEVRGGYQAMDLSFITMTFLATTSLNLGSLSVATVAAATTSVAVTTDCPEGYAITVTGISNTMLNGVSDGTVSSGSEEYGVAVSGIDRAFSDDRAITTNLTLASSSTPVTNAQSTLTFKASISSLTAPGARSQSIILTGSTNI